MKSKTLISIAVASTLGLSAAAFAGSGHQRTGNGHEVITPLSVSESAPWLIQPSKGGFGSQELAAIGSVSDEAGGSVSFQSSDASTLSSGDETASLSMDDTLALADDGIYSDYILVSFTPVSMEGWDYYIIDMEPSDQLSSSEDFSSDQLASAEDLRSDQLASSEALGSDEVAMVEEVYFLTPVYEITLAPVTLEMGALEMVEDASG